MVDVRAETEEIDEDELPFESLSEEFNEEY